MKKITQKQKELIDDMNEFCDKKFYYDENTDSKLASKYIGKNIEEFKLKILDNFQLRYL